MKKTLRGALLLGCFWNMLLCISGITSIVLSDCDQLLRSQKVRGHAWWYQYIRLSWDTSLLLNRIYCVYNKGKRLCWDTLENIMYLSQYQCFQCFLMAISFSVWHHYSFLWPKDLVDRGKIVEFYTRDSMAGQSGWYGMYSGLVKKKESKVDRLTAEQYWIEEHQCTGWSCKK